MRISNNRLQIQRPRASQPKAANSTSETRHNADTVQLNGAAETSSAQILPSKPEPPEDKGPLELTRADLSKPLKEGHLKSLMEDLSPGMTLEKLAHRLFAADPASASNGTFVLKANQNEDWKDLRLQNVRKLSHGTSTSTIRLFKNEGSSLRESTYIEYTSKTLPTVQQLPESIQEIWSERFSDSPKGMIDGLEHKHGKMGKKSEFFVYVGLSEGHDYSSFHCQAENKGQKTDLRFTKDETNLSTSVNSQALKEGTSLPAGVKETWQEWGFTPKGLARRMLSDTNVRANSVRAGIKEDSNGTTLTVGLELKGTGEKEQEHAGYFNFSFSQSEKDGQTTPYVYHDLLMLEKDFQSHGTAKTVLRNNFRLYDELKVDHVDLQAAITVGGYAWARYGWQLKDTEKNHENIGKQLTERLESLELKSSTKSTLKKLIASKNPKKLWAISDMKHSVMKDGKSTTLGKAMLLGTNWKGTFDMKDAASRQRLENYLGA